MDSLALRWLNKKTISYQEVCGKGASQIGFDEVSIERATEYAAEDADITLRLHHAMWHRLETNEKLRFIYERIQLPTAPVMKRVQRNGVLLELALMAAEWPKLGLCIFGVGAGETVRVSSPLRRFLGGETPGMHQRNGRQSLGQSVDISELGEEACSIARCNHDQNNKRNHDVCTAGHGDEIYTRSEGICLDTSMRV